MPIIQINEEEYEIVPPEAPVIRAPRTRLNKIGLAALKARKEAKITALQEEVQEIRAILSDDV